MAAAIGVFLIGILLVLTGLRYLRRGFNHWRWMRVYRSWPTVMGKISRSRVRMEGPDDDPTFSHAYAPDVWFEYSVGGRMYSRPEFSPDRSLDTEANVQKLIDRYPLFQHVTVHYNPRDPGDALLDPAEDTQVGRNLGLGIGGLLAGIILVIGVVFGPIWPY